MKTALFVSTCLMATFCAVATPIQALGGTGDTGRVALESNQDDHVYRLNDVYTMNADGADKVRLTTGASSPFWGRYPIDPAFSPDGTKIVFVGTGGENGSELWTMNADGSGLTRITNTRMPESSPSWSPNGTQIVFSRPDDRFRSNPELYVVNADGTGYRQLTDDGEFQQTANIDPDWLADGRIVFSSNRNGTDYDLFLLSSGGGDTELTDYDGNEFQADGSPDGTKVAFNQNGPGDPSDVYVINVNGTGRTRLTSHPGRDERPSWSPDGSKLAFDSDRLGFTVQIFTMNANGSNVEQISLVGSDNRAPSWGPGALDSTPPTVTCGAADGLWHRENMSVSCTASDGGSGLADPEDESFALATSVAAGEENADAATGSRSVCDRGGNCVSAGPIGGNKVDRRVPAASCDGPDELWHGENVSVACTASDGGSGLGDSGDETFALATTVLAGEENADAATGSRSICDRVGNCVTAGPIGGHKVDRRAPAVSCGAADELWHADNVSVACTASDTGSGLSHSGDESLTLATSVPVGEENADAATDSRWVCDRVGNCVGAGPIGGNKVDRRAPAVTCGGPDELWHGENVSVACTAGDAGSGLGDPGDESFALATSVAEGEEDADAATGSRSVCDRVDNCASAGPIRGNGVDRKAPTVSCDAADERWHGENVSIACSAGDGGSGLGNSADESFALATSVAAGEQDASAATSSRSVCDRIGNCVTAGPIGGNNIDRKAPAVEIAVPGDQTSYGLGEHVAASYSCSDDGGAGVAACSGAVDHGARIDTATPGPHRFEVSARDNVGNVSSKSVTYTVRPDTTAPSILLTTPPDGAEYSLGQPVTAEYECLDQGGSGLSECVGTVPSGASLDTSSLGPKRFVVDARDAAGNASSVERSYTVVDRTAPLITLRTPADGGRYVVGSTLTVDFSCVDEAGGSGVIACRGDESHGQTLATTTPGDFTFTVASEDAAGNRSTATARYSVVCTVTGTPGNDVFGGTPGNDVICGLGGDDVIFDSAGADAVFGGDGKDEYVIKSVEPRLIPTAAGVTVSLDGEANDGLPGEGDNIGVDVENLRGGSGPDTLVGSSDANKLAGSEGQDVLIGGAGDDVLVDRPFAFAEDWSGDDRADGGPGSDYIELAFGDDQASGGDGADSIDGGAGNDRLDGGPGSDLIRGDGDWTQRGSDVVRGGAGDDFLFGTNGRDIVAGEDGNDYLVGDGACHNAVCAGPGENADLILGGAGTDTVSYIEQPLSVRVSLVNDGAVDGSNGEADFVGGDIENIRGGAGPDHLIGNAGPNVIQGHGGDDTIDGGDGSDSLFGDHGPDTTSFGAPGADKINAVDRSSGDVVNCGSNPAGMSWRVDSVDADVGDDVASDCETVKRKK